MSAPQPPPAGHQPGDYADALVEPDDDREAALAPAEPRPIAAVLRALSVLDAFAAADERTIGVSELARQTGMSRSGAYRLLVTLRAGGYVDYDDDSSRYALGSGALRIGSAYRRQNDLLRVAAGAIRALAAETGETAVVSVRRQATRVNMDQVVSPNELNVTVKLGVPFPLHAGASSKAILAFLPDDELDAYVAAGLEAVTPRTVVDERELRAQLARIRRRGCASSEAERQPGAVAVAAPIFDASGAAIGSLAVAGPAARMTAPVRRAAEQLVVAAARGVSERVG